MNNLMNGYRPFAIATILLLLFLISNTVFVVDQREQALVLQFGQPVREVNSAGLHFKVPFMQNTVFFDKRILDLSAEPHEVIASDEKRLIVDAFAKYKITDPLKFYQTVRNEAGIHARLNSILDSRLREVLGSFPLSALLTGKRDAIMTSIRENVNNEAKGFGIDVVDVRIMRADLPEKNEEAIFLRMQTEREREAKEFRAQGAEEAQRTRSAADKERTVILAEANKQAQLTRGDGDSKAAKIFADAFERDPDFYRFYRTMQAYRETLKNGDTTMVLSPNSEFMRYFNNGEKQ